MIFSIDIIITKNLQSSKILFICFLTHKQTVTEINIKANYFNGIPLHFLCLFLKKHLWKFTNSNWIDFFNSCIIK